MNKHFRSIELTAKKYLDNYSSGLHPTALKDSLIEVDVVRQYQPGDRRLDSKSSLKTGITMSRVFNPERSLSIYVILDLSSSQYSKLEASLVTALYLCYLGDMCNEKVGLCVFSDKIISALEVSDDYSSTVGTLEKAFKLLKMDTGTAIEDAVHRVGSMGLTNSIIVLISDFCYTPSDNFYSCIKKMAGVSTNSFVNIVMYNPNDWLQNLAESFKITLRDAETGRDIEYDAKDANSKFASWATDLKTKLSKCHSDVVFLDVKQDRFLMPLVKYLMRNK